MAGDGPLASSFEGAEVLGWRSSGEIRNLMAKVALVLVPSYWQEPFGMVGAEALAEATPVVVSDTGGVVEWADRGCLRVPSGDVAAMAAAIRSLVEDPDTARRLGHDGRAMVRERFAREPIEQKLDELYRETAGL